MAGADSISLSFLFANGIDSTPREAFERLATRESGGIFIVSFEEFGGEETRIPFSGNLDDDGICHMAIGVLPVPASSRRFFKVLIDR